MEQQCRERKMVQRRCRRTKRRIVKRLFRFVCIGLAALMIILGIRAYRGFWGIHIKEYWKYPKSLITLLKRNPEAKDFVLDYPLNKDKDYDIDLTDEVLKGTIPLFLQWDERWGYEYYGSDFLAITGCGPTCLSMVRCGLSGNAKWDPLQVANRVEEEGFYVEGVGSSWDLMTKGAQKIGLTVHNVIYDEEHIREELTEGHPIICIMGPGDFTTSGHFIVLTGVDEEGKVVLCDPNSRCNSEKSWEAADLIPQIRNLWGYTYTE